MEAKDIGMEANYFQIIKDSLGNHREVDEETFASLAILDERLDRLKKIDSIFRNVTFSPAVEELRKKKKTMVVC